MLRGPTCAPAPHASLDAQTSQGSYDYGTADFGASLCRELTSLNLSLCLFNLLLPCWPLDGGRICADVLLLRRLPAERAAEIVVKCSCVVIAALAGWALFLFIDGSLGFALTVLMTCWLGFQTWQLHVLVRAGRVQNHPLFGNVSAPASGGAGGPPSPLPAQSATVVAQRA